MRKTRSFANQALPSQIVASWAWQTELCCPKWSMAQLLLMLTESTSASISVCATQSKLVLLRTYNTGRRNMHGICATPWHRIPISCARCAAEPARRRRAVELRSAHDAPNLGAATTTCGPVQLPGARRVAKAPRTWANTKHYLRRCGLGNVMQLRPPPTGGGVVSGAIPGPRPVKSTNWFDVSLTDADA